MEPDQQPDKKPGIMQRLFGNLGDPDIRRARQTKTKDELNRLESDALAVQAALDAGATEAALYQPDKAPEVGGQVIYRGGPATILKVITPGDPMSPVDLVGYQTGAPLAFAGVEHDLILGWHWLAEPPPPDPTPEDRIREARAAGVRFPNLGDAVILMVAAPRSYRGTVLFPLRAQIRTILDVDLGGPNPGYSEESNVYKFPGTALIEPRLPSTIWVELALDDVQPEDVNREWPPSYRFIDLAGLDLTRVAGPLQPNDRGEGWGFGPRRIVVNAPEQHNLFKPDRPCDRCGNSIPSGKNGVRFYAADPRHSLNTSEVCECFARVCSTCAMRISRFVFGVDPEPASATILAPDPAVIVSPREAS